MKKAIISGILLMIFLAVGMLGYADESDPMQGQDMKGMAVVGNKDLVLSGKIEDGVRVIDVTAMKYKFDPDPIVVAQGDKVRLVVTSKDATHGLAIKAYKVNVVVNRKAAKTAEFTADKKGTFDVRCSVFCGFGHSHMHAKFVVK